MHEVGETVSVSFNDVTDADGISSPISTHWYVKDENDEYHDRGISDTYTIQDNDLGLHIAYKQFFTDGKGETETSNGNVSVIY